MRNLDLSDDYINVRDIADRVDELRAEWDDLAECDDFTRAYVEAIYFTETGDMGQPDSDCPLYAVDLADTIAELGMADQF